MPRFFDPAQREAPAEPSQGVGHTLQSGPATCESGTRHPRLTVRPAAGQTVRTPHSDWSPSCGQGDPGWTPSRIQFGKTCGLTFLRRNAVEIIPWHGVLTCVQPRTRSPATGGTNLRGEVHNLHLGMPNGGGDDHRSLELEQAPLPH